MSAVSRGHAAAVARKPIDRPTIRLATLVAAAAIAGCAAPPTSQRASLERIEHVIVIYAENRSFDNLYGLFPGANGLANATPAQYTQVDH